MPFIRKRGLRTDDNGHVVAGFATLVESKYDPDAKSGHSRQVVRESLGRILMLDEGGRSGVFDSRTRGIVAYDADKDEFGEVSRDSPLLEGCPRIPEMATHVRFGSVHLLLRFLQKEGLLRVLRDVFEDDRWFGRALAHVAHGILRDGSGITCDLFVDQTVLAMLLPMVDPNMLRCDSACFARMGTDKARLAFFTAVVKWMRGRDPEFGHGCYVDATPLPNDIRDNPCNALRCEKAGDWSEQMRLALVTDRKTGVPVWHEVFPGDQMDVNTLRHILRDVLATLGIGIDSLVLDSGYASRDLAAGFMGPGSGCSVVVRMPARRGYPYKTLYHGLKDQIHRPKYFFVRKGSLFFGRRREEIIFSTPVQAYVYTDHRKAQAGLAARMTEHGDEFESLTDREKRWLGVRSGYFVLLSNRIATPSEMLDDYLSRVHIESVIKDAKSFERLMPLRKWDDRTVRGKILHDIFDTVVRGRLLAIAAPTGRSIGDLFHSVEALECFLDPQGVLWIGTPVKRTREAYKVFDQKVPASIQLSAWKKSVLSASDVVPVL